MKRKSELNYAVIGRRIQEERLKRRFTQEQLAEAADISKGHLGHIESGATKCGLESLVRIANALHTSVDALLQDELHNSDLFSKSIMVQVDRLTDGQKEVILHTLMDINERINNQPTPED